jgi:hypothetical protein
VTAVTTFKADRQVTWSIQGSGKVGFEPVPADLPVGASNDVASVRIDPATGSLVFVTPPDFEAPADVDRNNTYVVTIKAVDAFGSASYQNLTVRVVDVDETGAKLSQLGERLQTEVRRYAAAGLGDMLSFNEALMRGSSSQECAHGSPSGSGGSIKADGQDGSVALGLSGALTDCNSASRIQANVGFVSSRTGLRWNSRWFASLRAEHPVDADLTLGVAALVSKRSAQLENLASGSISDRSWQINAYSRLKLGRRVTTGAFAGFGVTRYNLNLTDQDDFTLNGHISGNRRVYGWMLSGDFNFAGTTITTDAAVSHATEDLGSAIASTRYRGEIRSNVAIRAGRVDTTRISIPFAAAIDLNGITKADTSYLYLRPGLLCEDSDAEHSAVRCGYQLGTRLTLSNRGSRQFYADYRWESVGGTRRSLFGLGYSLPIDRHLPLEIALEANRNLGGLSSQQTRATIAVRTVH